METGQQPVIGVVGGTGDLGHGLVKRWARAGYRVVVGSRTLDKAEATVASLTEALTESTGTPPALEAATNIDAARQGDVVVVTVPFASQKDTLESIASAVAGKVLVDVTVPLVPPKVARVQLPEGGSAGQIAQALLGESVRVVSAFQNVPASQLSGDGEVACDVLVCGNDKEARQQVIDLITAIGMRGFHAGLINNAAAAEALTSVLINLNRQYKTHTGIRITGID